MFEELQTTGLLTLQEQSDLPTLSGLVWRLILLRYEHFLCKNSQIYQHLMVWRVEQTGLMTVNGLTSLQTLLTSQAFFYWHY